MFAAEMRPYDVPVPWKKNYDHVREAIWDKVVARMVARGRSLDVGVPDPWERPWRQASVEWLVVLVLHGSAERVEEELGIIPRWGGEGSPS